MSSNNHNHEPIYSQGDMDNVLSAIAKFKREVELSNQLLWATVKAAGGHVSLPYENWSGEPTRELVMWDDPQTYAMHIQIKFPDEPEQDKFDPRDLAILGGDPSL